MKQIVLSDVKQVSLLDVEIPEELKDNEVLIEVKMVTLCGSDLSYFNREKLPYGLEYPIVLGHEVSGVVHEIGKNVTKVKIGDRVAIEPQYFCGECDYCKKGQYNFCRNSKFMASKGTSGALSQYIIWDDKTIHKLDENISFEVGALIEPLSVAYSGVQKANLASDSKVVILGGGSIGILAASLIDCLYPDVEYYIVERFEEKKKYAKELNISESHFITQSKENNVEFTHILDTTGNTSLIKKYVECSKLGCKCVMIGLSEVEFPFTIKEMVYKGMDISCVYRYTNTYPLLQDIIRKSDIPFEKIITQIYGVDQVQEAFEMASDSRQSMKVLIDFTK